jgi:hypothetical protein
MRACSRNKGKKKCDAISQCGTWAAHDPSAITSRQLSLKIHLRRRIIQHTHSDGAAGGRTRPNCKRAVDPLTACATGYWHREIYFGVSLDAILMLGSDRAHAFLRARACVRYYSSSRGCKMPFAGDFCS